MKKNYQLIPVLLIIVIGFNISFWIHFNEKEDFLNNKQSELTESVTNKTNSIRNRLESTFSTIEILEHLFETNNNVSRDEFKKYTTPILKNNSEINAISWVPKIKESEQQKFNSKIKDEKIIEEFSIKELNNQNEFIKASKRDFYFTVDYIEPLEENKQALGYDIFSDDKRKSTILEAIKARKLQLTPAIKLVQDTIGKSFLGILPVFDYSKSTYDTLNFNHVKGLISTVYKIDNLINTALLLTEGRNINLQINDITNGMNDNIYTNGFSIDKTYHQKRIIKIGGRIWELNFTPKPVFFESKNEYNSLIIAIFTTFFLSFFFFFFQIRDKKNKKIQLQLKTEQKERRQAEGSLLKIDEYQANILKTAMDGFWMIDSNGKLLEVNDTYCKMSGYSRKELLQMSVSDLKAYVTESQTLQRLKKIKEIGEDRFETQHRRKDGTIFDVEASVQCKPPGSDYMVVFLKDITERKQSEKLMRESEKKFSTLYNNSPDMYVSVSPIDAKILECNDTLLKITKYTREEVIGAPIFKMYHDDCIEEVKKTFQQFLETGKVKDKELILQTKDGDKIIVSLNVNSVKDEAENTIYSISSWRDITETKKAKEKLEENANFIESIINASPDIIYIYDIQEQRNVYINEGMQLNLGYSDNEIKEMGNQVIPILMHPDDFNIYLQNIVPKYSTLRDKEILSHEYRMKDKAGNWRWLHSKESIFLRTHDGEPKQIFGISNDITDIKKTELELQKHRENLEELVNERTLELEEKNKKLDRMNQLFVGRELRMKELKEEIEKLKKNS